MTRPSLLLGAALLALAAPAQAETALYTGFTLIDPESETRTPDSWLLVEDGLIAAVGQGAPPAADETRDMSGLYALPGFIDGHAHVTASGILDLSVSEDGAVAVSQRAGDRFAEHNGRIALSRGVTTIRNPAGDPEANARYDEMIAAGAWIGPEAVHAGAIIQPPPMGGGMVAYPRTEAEWDAEAARQAALGMRYFKLYTDLSEDEIASGVRAAKAHGLTPIAHLNAVSWTRAVELGVEQLEHALPTSVELLEPAVRETYSAGLGPDSKYMYRWFELADYDGPLMQELFALLAERQVVVDLTLVVNEIVYNTDRVETLFPPEELADALPETLAVYAPQLRISATGWTEDDYRRAQAVMPKVLELARRLHDAGVPMLIGTDAGGGVLYARELELHTEAGIPVWEVLRMATSDGADILGLGDRTGRIATGMEADIVFLRADPTADVANASQVEGVLSNGDYQVSADLRRQPQ